MKPDAASRSQRGAADPSDTITLKEAAALLRCCQKTVRQMALNGKLPGKRVGKLWRFSRSRLTEWMQQAS